MIVLSVAEVLNQLNQSPNQRALLRNQRGMPSSASSPSTSSNSNAASSALSILNAVAAAAANGRPSHASFLAEAQISPSSLHEHHLHSQISSPLNANSFNGQSEYNLSSVSSESSTSSLNYHSDVSAYSAAAAAAAAAAVYSQLDNSFSTAYSPINYQSSPGSLNHGSSLKLSTKAPGSLRHNPYSRNSNNSSSFSSQPLNNSCENDSQNASVNAAAAFLSTLGGAANYPGNTQMASNYSAAFYYHPYYTHHYLNNHANTANYSANSIVDLNANVQKN